MGRRVSAQQTSVQYGEAARDYRKTRYQGFLLVNRGIRRAAPVLESCVEVSVLPCSTKLRIYLCSQWLCIGR